jgi:hypothetical protein
MAEAGHPDRVYPAIAEAYSRNTICVGYGTAGVVHALGKSGLEVPREVAERLRRDALADADRLAPGLINGLAGIAWVPADRGHLEEAAHLLDLAQKHPIIEGCATYAEGSAGVALALASRYGHTATRCTWTARSPSPTRCRRTPGSSRCSASTTRSACSTAGPASP